MPVLGDSCSGVEPNVQFKKKIASAQMQKNFNIQNFVRIKMLHIFIS